MQSSILLLVCLVLGCISTQTNARTILWTNAGGNPLWNNAGNWDCQCLPTADDDVVIDIQNIPGNVQVGGVVAPALAKSLKVGGTSRFPQTLTITGPINIGSGNSVLAQGSFIKVMSSPESPFKNDGTFTVHGNGFVFSTGTLAGAGSFVFEQDSILNLTDAATKTISTNVVVNGKAITHTDKASNLAFAKGGKMVISGSFNTGTSLSLATDASSSFTVKGSFSFNGKSLSFQGSGFNLGSWSVGGTSAVLISNGITSGTLSVASGGVVTLIGAPTESRTFQTTLGSGTFQVQGGANNFGSLAAASLQGAGGNATITTGDIGSFVLTGAFIGGGKISAKSAVLTGGFLVGGIQLKAASLEFQGSFSISDDGTALIVGTSGSVSKSTILTLTGGSTLQVASGATFKQAAPFQLVQGPPQAKSPQIVNNGVFSSSSSLTVSGLHFEGTGSHNLDSSATYALTNAVFSASTFTSAGSVTLTAGSFSVPTVTGAGAYTVGSQNSFITTSLSAGDFQLNAGSVSVSNCTLNDLSLLNGAFSVESGCKIGTFSFLGGKVVGSASGKQASITAQSTALKGSSTQTITNAVLSSGSVSLECTSGNCQLFTSNAALKTVSSH